MQSAHSHPPSAMICDTPCGLPLLLSVISGDSVSAFVCLDLVLDDAARISHSFRLPLLEPALASSVSVLCRNAIDVTDLVTLRPMLFRFRCSVALACARSIVNMGSISCGASLIIIALLALLDVRVSQSRMASEGLLEEVD